MASVAIIVSMLTDIVIINFIQTIAPGILNWFQWSKWPPKALKKTFQIVPKISQGNQYFTELSADQSVITKLLDTKLLISQKLLDVIIYFNNYCEALFNALLSVINRTQGNKIL